MKTLLCATFSLFANAASACELALVLAHDVSASVNSQEYEIQRSGLAAALKSPDVKEAILNSAGPVRLFVFEWSDTGLQAVIQSWTSPSTDLELDNLSEQIASRPRSIAGGRTALGDALTFGAAALAQQPDCRRKVIDVSGDGVNNDGPAPEPLNNGLVVNGLVIKGATPDPEAYYRENVIQGPGAFVAVARNGFEDYPDLIRGKLLREIKPPLFISAAPRANIER